MFRAELLKAKMVANNINAEVLSDKLGINPATFYRKMSGESEFTRLELTIIRAVLKLTAADMDAIFFAE